MYLGNVFLDLGYSLIQKTSGQGPDLHFKHQGTDVWIEAVVPTQGEGEDAVPNFANHNRFEPLPEDEILLRFTSSIFAKHQQHQKYLSEGVLRPSDVFIIALNGSVIPFADFYDGMPMYIKSVLPLGEEVVTIDPEEGRVIDNRHLYRGTITKRSGSEVSTRTFMDEEYSGICGLIYSTTASWRFPARLGEDLSFLHNPRFVGKIDRFWMGVGEVFWVEEDRILGQRIG